MLSGATGMNTLLANWTPRLLSVLRIVAGFLFMQHGTQKWLAFPVARATPTELWTLSGAAGVLELGGGFLLCSASSLDRWPCAIRPDGIRLFYAHAPAGFWPIVNRGELAALYCFVFLYIAAAGGGPGARTGGCESPTAVPLISIWPWRRVPCLAALRSTGPQIGCLARG
jgi:putative oxidoreductase